MKKEFHQASTRGHVNIGWLDSHHTFSFGDYYDPKRMGFAKLRVLNDDIVQPSKGFATHPHQDMEIVSIPLSGELEHKDTLGNGSIITSNEVQLMSAGTGISHSEFNPSHNHEVNLLQIWILPETKGLSPSYQQKQFDETKRSNQLQCIVSPDGREGSLKIHQQAFFSLLNLTSGMEFEYSPFLDQESGLYVFLIEGEISIDGQVMKNRDGLAIEDHNKLVIRSQMPSEILLIESTLL